MDIYQFMVDIYERDWRNGVAAPYLEYALSSDWMDKSYTHRNRIWEDNGKIVAFVFTESPVTDVYFSLRPGYEDLAEELVQYAENMPNLDNKRQLVILGEQEAIIKAAETGGYTKTGGYDELIHNYESPLDFNLPKGFHFTEIGGLDIGKVLECCWKGFNHEIDEGKPWDGNVDVGLHIANAPHATFDYAVAVVDDATDKYACYAGMWWVPQNKLAYMEPLCTVPEYRKMGLAAAALSELYRRMKPLGANHMTGGGNEFYKKIGYTEKITWTFWKKA